LKDRSRAYLGRDRPHAHQVGRKWAHQVARIGLLAQAPQRVPIGNPSIAVKAMVVARLRPRLTAHSWRRCQDRR